jgi:nitrous oxidase accessory protein NosD
MRRVLWVVGLLSVGRLAGASSVTVHPGESIQAAIDRVPPGSTVRIEPGVYREADARRALTITKDGIRLVGLARPGHPVVIEATGGQVAGVYVSPPDTIDVGVGQTFDPEDFERPPCGVSGDRITGFGIRGLTVRGFAGFGIYLACVDRFQIRRNTASANTYYAIFPVRSSRGRMTANVGTGTQADACLYVGQSEHVRVDHNLAMDCLIGLQIENCLHVRMTRNRAVQNTSGIIVDVIDERQTTTTADNTVAFNVIRDNNRQNTAPLGAENAMIPPGIGLTINGADRTRVVGNRFKRNGFVGLIIVNFCVGDPAACMTPVLTIDPNPDGNRVIGNHFVRNLVNVLYAPGAGAGGNCFARNRPASVDAATLPACH